MIGWQLSKRLNKQGEYTRYVWIENYQVCVFKRLYGWAYTVRAEMEGSVWIQISSDSNCYYINEELAKAAALRSAEILINMTEPVDDEGWKPPPGYEDIEDKLLEAMKTTVSRLIEAKGG